MARLCVDLGDYDAAERAYDPALAMLEQLVAEESSRDDYRAALAQCLYEAGHFYLWAIPEQAKMEALFRKAVEQFEKLAKTSPDAGFEKLIANAENILIRSRSGDGGRDEAIAHTRRMIARIEESGNATARSRGEAWRQLAELIAPVNPLEADDAFRRAIVHYREHTRTQHSTEDRFQFASLLNNAAHT